ncbi:MAG: sugar phosphate nucleotidyltransferase [Halobacteria archaeon]|nr:sugar phosphate nucleotidyltransferase [Halobacteria archaeon]
MKAVILAAGEGRRLKPLTNLRPKPMIPVANKPLLEHVVEAVAEAGIDETVIVVGYKRERIQSYFGDGNDWDVSVEYAAQERQLGTGHAVLQAEEYVDGDFVVLNGDRMIESDVVESIVDKHRDGDGTVVAVTRADEPSDYGVVETEGDEVVSITEKPPEYETQTDVINAGVYGFDVSVFDEIRDTPTGADGEISITSTLSRLIDRSQRVRAVRSEMWIDVSHLWDLIQVNSNAIDRGYEGIGDSRIDGDVVGSVCVGDGCRVGHNSTVMRGTSLGDNVRVGANAVVSNSVVLEDAYIGEGAVVKDAVVGANAVIEPNSTVAGGRSDVVVENEIHEDVRLGGVIGDNSRIGGGATVETGTVIGDGTTAEEGVRLSGKVPSDSEVRRG